MRGLKLANGRSIALTERNTPREQREAVLHSVCTRFTTVLGPGSDGYHEDHIHLDIAERRGNYRICQWDVWDEWPRIAPLMPAAASGRSTAARSGGRQTGGERRSLQSLRRLDRLRRSPNRSPKQKPRLHKNSPSRSQNPSRRSVARAAIAVQLFAVI